MKSLALATLVASSVPLSSTAFASDWGNYLSTAEATKVEINKGNVKKAGKLAKKLVSISTKLLPQVAEKHSQCQEYLSVALSAATKMQNISLEAIEKDYHADGKLPQVKDVKCYHAKDLLVHPATVVVLAKQANKTDAVKAQMLDEIDEVIEHFSQVKESVK
jgi:hypothetical protein